MITREKTILVVEDDSDIRALLSLRLQSRGYNVLIAGDGEEALDILEKKMPNALLLDIGIPKKDGFDVCQRIKQLQSAIRLPVITLSALDTADERRRALQAGAVAHISKPFDVDELIKTLERIIK